VRDKAPLYCCKIISISNIVISILIAGVEESLNDVKMIRLAISILLVSAVFAGNSQSNSIETITNFALLADIAIKLKSNEYRQRCCKLLFFSILRTTKSISIFRKLAFAQQQ